MKHKIKPTRNKCPWLNNPIMKCNGVKILFKAHKQKIFVEGKHKS